mgnify:CR=1 FL=1
MKTLFRRQLLITLGAMVFFSIIAIFLSDLSVRAVMDWSRKENVFSPTDSVARLVHQMAIENSLPLEKVVATLNHSAIEFPPTDVTVITSSDFQKLTGKSEEALPIAYDKPYTPPQADPGPPDQTFYRTSTPGKILHFTRRMTPPPGAPSAMPPPPGLGGGPRHRGPPPIFLWTFAALVASGFLAAALSLFWLFSMMRKKAREASSVITAIKNGDFGQRMPIDRLDEVGHMMQEFNRMADEIETALTSLKRSEAARTLLLQELAHDLRTPIASLKGLIETLDLRGEQIQGPAKKELFGLTYREIEYFSRLVEDLLFLAQVQDPRYFNKSQTIQLDEMVRDEAEHFRHLGKSIVVEASRPMTVAGDHLLLRRMLKNAIQNAVSFAHSEVKIRLSEQDSFAQIEVNDDGPGFKPESLRGFGEKRGTRRLDADDNSRLSVGLGSVIMKTAAELHGGKLSATNTDVGARLTILIPSK